MKMWKNSEKTGAFSVLPQLSWTAYGYLLDLGLFDFDLCGSIKLWEDRERINPEKHKLSVSVSDPI